MIAGEQLHRPSDALAQVAPVAVDRRRTVNDPGDPAASGNDEVGSRSLSEFALALGGGAALLVLAVLLYMVAGWFGVGTADAAPRALNGLSGAMAHGEQFAGLFLAGALGTFIAREFAVKPR